MLRETLDGFVCTSCMTKQKYQTEYCTQCGTNHILELPWDHRSYPCKDLHNFYTFHCKHCGTAEVLTLTICPNCGVINI